MHSSCGFTAFLAAVCCVYYAYVTLDDADWLRWLFCCVFRFFQTWYLHYTIGGCQVEPGMSLDILCPTSSHCLCCCFHSYVACWCHCGKGKKGADALAPSHTVLSRSRERVRKREVERGRVRERARLCTSCSRAVSWCRHVTRIVAAAWFSRETQLVANGRWIVRCL